MSNFINLVGKAFGRLIVIEYIGKDKHRHSLWKCRCTCGNECITLGYNLQNGNTTSCGCVRKEINKKRLMTHGLSDHQLYFVHYSIIDRCYNIDCNSYQYYGNRGIKVCKEWLDEKDGFINFYKWAKDKWENGLEINRIDNNGDYEPENCEFTSHRNNSQNRRPSLKRDLPIGVYKNGKKFIAKTWIKDKEIHLGTFNTTQEASNVRENKVKESLKE